MKGLVLMTDNSCSKFRFSVEDNLFRHQILNDSTFFFFKKKRHFTGLEYIYIVQFGAELKSFILIRLHLAQAVVRTVCLCISPFQRNNVMTFKTSIVKRNMRIRAVY